MIKFTSAADAAKLIKSGDHVYIQGSTSIPETVIDAMCSRASELRGVKIYSAFAIGDREAPYALPQMRDSFEINSFFVANNIRKAIARGDAQTIPAFLGEIPAILRSGLIPIDVCLINVSTPDQEGYCSYSISADITVSAVETAKIVIAQINKYMPHNMGDARIHISKITAAIEGDLRPVELPVAVPNATESAIGRYIAELVPDGATLQIGVGGIPNAVLDALHGHKHLGLHTEAMTDGVVPLLNSGIIDNSLKKVHPGKNIASLALGSRRLYEYMDNNPDLIVKDVAYSNDPAIIRQNPRVMAINSALEIDLTGQICADSIGTTIYSGVGGQHDFMYGASLSEGGKCFIALPAATQKGISKIVPTLTTGAGVVTTRFQAQYIVTEYGVAFLKDKNLAERAKALIAIAHPDSREALERAAAERFGYGFTRLR